MLARCAGSRLNTASPVVPARTPSKPTALQCKDTRRLKERGNS